MMKTDASWNLLTSSAKTRSTLNTCRLAYHLPLTQVHHLTVINPKETPSQIKSLKCINFEILGQSWSRMESSGRDAVWAGIFWRFLNVSLRTSDAQLRLDIVDQIWTQFRMGLWGLYQLRIFATACLYFSQLISALLQVFSSRSPNSTFLMI